VGVVAISYLIVLLYKLIALLPSCYNNLLQHLKAWCISLEHFLLKSGVGSKFLETCFLAFRSAYIKGKRFYSANQHVTQKLLKKCQGT
jgi:hypothetical protein